MEQTPPAIILVGAQLGENIGMVARAMLNFGLTDLRLVTPQAGWDKEKALAASAGADDVIENHATYATTKQAIADLHFTIATTARLRDMVKPVLTPHAAAQQLRAPQNTKTGILFGREKSGLTNDDVSLADAICRVPLNPDFSSLNLAQAVLLLGYEWYQAADETASSYTPHTQTHPATRAETSALFDHLEAALKAAGFLAPPEKAPAMMRNIRNLLHRAQLTEQDIRTFRGMINALLLYPRNEADEATKAQISALSKGEKHIDI